MKKTIVKNQIPVAVHFATDSDINFSFNDVTVATPATYAVTIREFLQNNRQGTLGSKSRGEVSGSNKKPWKQKGTGRARAGARTSPLWRGGGVIFGPQPRVKKLKVGKKVKKVVAINLLKQMIDQKRVLFLDWMLSEDRPSTKSAFSLLKEKNLDQSTVNVFLSIHDVVTVASFANLPFVRIIFFDAPHIYALSDAHYWVVLKKDLDLFKSMIKQWNE